jgi:hypothetical protein
MYSVRTLLVVTATSVPVATEVTLQFSIGLPHEDTVANDRVELTQDPGVVKVKSSGTGSRVVASALSIIG